MTSKRPGRKEERRRRSIWRPGGAERSPSTFGDLVTCPTRLPSIRRDSFTRGPARFIDADSRATRAHGGCEPLTVWSRLKVEGRSSGIRKACFCRRTARFLLLSGKRIRAALHALAFACGVLVVLVLTYLGQPSPNLERRVLIGWTFPRASQPPLSLWILGSGVAWFSRRDRTPLG